MRIVIPVPFYFLTRDSKYFNDLKALTPSLRKGINKIKQQEMTWEIGETTSPCPLRRGIRKVNGQVLSPSGVCRWEVTVKT